MRFEDRLRRTVGSVLGALALGCDGGETDTGGGGGTTDLSAVCDGEAPPADFQLNQGFVTIDPGGECPDAADAQLQVHGCTFLEWQDVTCGFDRVDRDQVLVDDGYGGYFADQATAPTTGMSVGPVVDVCWYDAVFYLDPDHPTCGRPLLNEGRPVVAEVVGGGAWATEAHPVVAGLSDDERRKVGAYWLGAAALEHASVASFSWFALDLVRFGAPPELLHAAHQAALDEIAHAKLCFSLASGYLGRPVGPGALGALPTPAATLREVAEALLREGCVGETLAAVDAAARLAGARDPAVRAALARIVRDESAHAALAWRALKWMLGQDEGLYAHLSEVLAAEATRAWPGEGASRSAEAHGLLSDAARAAAVRRAWDEVIRPSWAALA